MTPKPHVTICLDCAQKLGFQQDQLKKNTESKTHQTCRHCMLVSSQTIRIPAGDYYQKNSVLDYISDTDRLNYIEACLREVPVFNRVKFFPGLGQFTTTASTSNAQGFQSNYRGAIDAAIQSELAKLPSLAVPKDPCDEDGTSKRSWTKNNDFECGVANNGASKPQAPEMCLKADPLFNTKEGSPSIEKTGKTINSHITDALWCAFNKAHDKAS